MAGPIYADCVKDVSATPGTGTLTLAGTPPTGSQPFSIVGDGNTCYYRAATSDETQVEVGLGTYSSTGPTLARTTVEWSTNSNSHVNFTAPVTVELVASSAFFTASQANIGALPSSRTATTNTVIALSDVGNTIIVNASVGTSVEIPAQSSVTFPNNAYIDVLNIGTANTEIVSGAGIVKRYKAGTVLIPNSPASLFRVASDDWHICGELVGVSGLIWNNQNIDVTSAASTLTFSNVTVGSPQSNRKIIGVIAWSDPGGTAATLGSVTINGTSAALDANATTSFQSHGIAIFSAPDTGFGSLATVVANFNKPVVATFTSYTLYTNGTLQDTQSQASGIAQVTLSTTASTGDYVIGASWITNNTNVLTRLTMSQVASNVLDSSFTSAARVAGSTDPTFMCSRSINGATAGAVSVVSTSESLTVQIGCTALVRWNNA